jgi:hypothetical protein
VGLHIRFLRQGLTLQGPPEYLGREINARSQNGLWVGRWFATRVKAARYRGKKYYGFFLEDLYTEHYCNAIKKALEGITGKELPFCFKKESRREYFRKALSTKPLYQKIRSFFAKNNALKQVYRTLKRY